MGDSHLELGSKNQSLVSGPTQKSDTDMDLARGGRGGVGKVGGGGEGQVQVVGWSGAKVREGNMRVEDEYDDDKVERQWRHGGGG
ncbi:hypothetical protein NL676_027445 [Syzygium grande]|nr:hypothetical protein NL676_027445 [Syzygium grande]